MKPVMNETLYQSSPPLATTRNYPKSPLNPSGTPFHQFKIGAVEIYQIFDGMTARDLTSGFLPNVSLKLVNAALKEEGFPENKAPNSYTITLARIAGHLIMFDSGNGEAGHPDSGHLRENLHAAGLDPEEISAIVITHFHPDHIYGLMTKSNTQIYPDIEILVPATEYAFWSDPQVFTQLPPARMKLAQRIQENFPNWKNISQFASGHDILPGIRAIATPGHSPGHTSLLIDTGSQPFMVTGDITNIPAFNMRHPSWHLAADLDPKLAAETRYKILDQLSTDRILCSGYHWGMPGAGIIEKSGEGYALINTENI